MCSVWWVCFLRVSCRERKSPSSSAGALRTQRVSAQAPAASLLGQCLLRGGVFFSMAPARCHSFGSPPAALLAGGSAGLSGPHACCCGACHGNTGILCHANVCAFKVTAKRHGCRRKVLQGARTERTVKMARNTVVLAEISEAHLNLMRRAPEGHGSWSRRENVRLARPVSHRPNVTVECRPPSFYALSLWSMPSPRHEKSTPVEQAGV